MDMVKDTITLLQLIASFATVVTIIIAVGRFAQKPNKTQDERLDALERRMDEVKARLASDSVRVDDLENGMRVMQEGLLALMSHAINGNDTAKLEKARDNMEHYLTHR